MALKTIKLRIHNTLNSNHQFVFLFLLVGEEEAEEWKRKYDIVVREAKAALEKAAIVQEYTNTQS